MTDMMAKAAIAAALIQSGQVSLTEVVAASAATNEGGKSTPINWQNFPALIILRDVTDAVYKSLEPTSEPHAGPVDGELDLEVG